MGTSVAFAAPLAVTTRVASNVPGLAVKRTLSSQLRPGSTASSQVPELARNCPASAPVTVGSFTRRDTSPVLVTFTAASLAPTGSNSSVSGLTLKVGREASASPPVPAPPPAPAAPPDVPESELSPIQPCWVAKPAAATAAVMMPAVPVRIPGTLEKKDLRESLIVAPFGKRPNDCDASTLATGAAAVAWPVVQVRLLGPLELVEGGRALPLGGAKERTVLAVLAVHAGHVVSEGQLIEALWGDEPPKSAVKTLQNYILRLRKALGRGDDSVTIETRPPGYVLVAAGGR